MSLLSLTESKLLIDDTLSNDHDLVIALNAPKNRSNIEALMRYDHPRIITSIATVFNRESTQKIRASGNLNLKIKNDLLNSPELSIKAQGASESLARIQKPHP